MGLFIPKPHQQSGSREGSEAGFSMTSWISNPGKDFFPWQNQRWVLETSWSVLPTGIGMGWGLGWDELQGSQRSGKGTEL